MIEKQTPTDTTGLKKAEGLSSLSHLTLLSDMASGAAHKINNPNQVILSNALLLTRMWLDISPILAGYYRENGDFSVGGLSYEQNTGTIKKLLDNITEGAYRINGIVENMRDLSGSEGTDKDGPVDINAVVGSVLAFLGKDIPGHTHNLICKYGGSVPPVKGNALDIKQALINILRNALQALPDKQCGVIVSTFEDREAGAAVIEIADEGKGIPEYLLQRVFEPFFTTRIEGGGLGLSLARKIVSDHKGSIDIRSNPGVGTSVIVRIPAIRIEDRSPA